jgi:hypothetical protein
MYGSAADCRLASSAASVKRIQRHFSNLAPPKRRFTYLRHAAGRRPHRRRPRIAFALDRRGAFTEEEFRPMIRPFLTLAALGLILQAPLPRAQMSTQTEAPTEVTFNWDTPPPSNAPIKLVKILVGDKEVQLGTPISVKGMWLRDVKIVLQNTSLKMIVSGGVILTYPETSDGTPQRPLITTPIIYGMRPDHAYLNKDGSMRQRSLENTAQPPLDIAPGATWTLTPGPDLGDHNQGTVIQAAGHVSQINIQITEYYFTDESLWRAGMYFVPEPAPERYRQVTPAEFNASQPQR